MTTNFSMVDPCGFTSVVVSRIAGTTRSMNVSSSWMRLFLNGFGNVSRSKSARAALPASSLRVGEHRRVDVLVVAQRDERDLDRRDR